MSLVFRSLFPYFNLKSGPKPIVVAIKLLPTCSEYGLKLWSKMTKSYTPSPSFSRSITLNALGEFTSAFDTHSQQSQTCSCEMCESTHTEKNESRPTKCSSLCFTANLFIKHKRQSHTNYLTSILNALLGVFFLKDCCSRI